MRFAPEPDVECVKEGRDGAPTLVSARYGPQVKESGN